MKHISELLPGVIDKIIERHTDANPLVKDYKTGPDQTAGKLIAELTKDLHKPVAQ